MPYPPKTADLQHEIELVAALGQGGRDLSVEQAERCVWGYAIGLDMTRRDLQGAAKKQGRPWEVGKAFDFSAPLGPLHARDPVEIGRASGRERGCQCVWIRVGAGS